MTVSTPVPAAEADKVAADTPWIDLGATKLAFELLQLPKDSHVQGACVQVWGMAVSNEEYDYMYVCLAHMCSVVWLHSMGSAQPCCCRGPICCDDAYHAAVQLLA